MRKIWIFGVLVAVFLTGCGARPVINASTESESTASTVEATTTNAIAEETATAKTAVVTHSTTVQTNKSYALRAMQIDPTAATTTGANKKMIYLDITKNIGTNSIRFKSVQVDYNNKLLIFQIDASKGVIIKYSCTDKNGSALETAYNATTIWVSKGAAIENYSKVNVTCIVEGTDPVTTTIDIPGI